MINSEIFQSIYDVLDKYLFDGWQKLVVLCECGEDSFSISFYEKVNNVFYSCFDIEGIDEKNMFEDFDFIHDLLETELKMQDEKWTAMTMIVDAEGNIKADFEYEDVMNDMLKRRTEWKKKYLI